MIANSMRKILYIVFAGLVFASCVREKAVENAAIPETFSIRASIPLTKISVSAEGKTTWDAGDEIGVFASGSVLRFRLVDGAGTAEGVFVTDDEYRGKKFNGVAVFPYDENASLEGSSVNIGLASSSSDGQVLPAPMVGTSEDGRAYTFRNVAGLLRIRYSNVPSLAQSVRITASHPISGIFPLSDYSTSVLELGSGTEGTVVTAGLPKTRSEVVSVDVPVPQGTLSSVKAELLDVDGNVLNTKSTTSPKTITAGKVLPLEVIEVPGNYLKLEWIWDKGTLPPFRSNFPAIDDAGNVYVVSNEGAVNKIDKNGNLVWRTSLPAVGGNVGTSPSVERDGSAVYISAGQNGMGAIYALNSDGSVKWQFSGYPWADVSGNRNFWQSIIGVGEENIYVPVGTLCTLLTINKSTGELVSYASGTGDGSRGNIGGLASGCAIGLAGTVSAMAQQGAYTWRKDWLDNSPYENPKYGKYAPYGYLDMWPGWYDIEYDNHGVLPIKKGDSGYNVLISCMQETYGRYDICCYPVSFALDNTLKDHDNAVTKYYWRHQIGPNSDTVAAAAIQDQGGVVMGHENSVIIIPMKDRPNAVDPKIGAGGLYAVWMGHTETDGGSSSWRVTTPGEDVAGAAAVDNNGDVHFASDEYYYIVRPDVLTDSYVILARESLKNIIQGAGIEFPVNEKGERYTGVWSSVKIAKGGKIYLNVNLSSSKGVTCCFSYPGVTGPDETSSWPQKGADQYNSCNQQL